jgi:antitoxin ParD1/3/4
MADIERLTITLPAEMAALVKEAVAGGDYASASEVIRDALRDWKMRRALQAREFSTLQSEYGERPAHLAEERMKEFAANPPGAAGRRPTDIRVEALRHFFDAVSQMPVKDARSIENILGYGPDGLPSQ